MERQPKYIEGLLTSAATRRLDRLRAEEKMLQRERELEGDEFADKEAYVTQAYKDQMAELRKAEEEEKQREGSSCLSYVTVMNMCRQRLKRRSKKERRLGWHISTANY